MKKILLFVGMIMFPSAIHSVGKVFKVLNTSTKPVSVEMDVSKTGWKKVLASDKACGNSEKSKSQKNKKAIIAPNTIGKFSYEETEGCEMMLWNVVADGFRYDRPSGDKNAPKFFIFNEIKYATQEDVDNAAKVNAEKKATGQFGAIVVELGQVLNTPLTPIAEKDFNDAVKKLEKDTGSKLKVIEAQR